jgi:hypothetical protein
MRFEAFAPLGMRWAEKGIQRIKYLVELRLLRLVRSEDRAKQRPKLFGLAITRELLKQSKETEALLHAYLKPATLQLGY